MILRKKHFIKVLRATHLSEKASTVMKKNNTMVLKVANTASKPEIKLAVKKMFDVEVKVVNTLSVKGKAKRHGQRIGYRSDWKKAYVTLRKDQNLDFIASAE